VKISLLLSRILTLQESNLDGTGKVIQSLIG